MEMMQSHRTSISQRSPLQGLPERDRFRGHAEQPFSFAPVIDCAVYRVFMATVAAAEGEESKEDWWARYSRNRETYRAIAERICDERIGVDGVPFAIVIE